MTIEDLKRRLSPGTIFRATFPMVRVIGNVGATIFPQTSTFRKVHKQGARMVSRNLDGSRDVYLDWAGVQAREEQGKVVLSDEGCDFMAIEFA